MLLSVDVLDDVGSVGILLVAILGYGYQSRCLVNFELIALSSVFLSINYCVLNTLLAQHVLDDLAVRAGLGCE